MSRNPEFERRFLVEAARGAGLEGDRTQTFCASVERRLILGAETYGEGSFMSSDVFGELSEEPLDIAAWGVLTAQRIAAEQLPDSEHIQLHLIHAAAKAAEAWVLIQDAMTLYRESERPEPVEPPYNHYAEE